MTKLSYEDKINLYNERKNGISISSLCSKYKLDPERVEYLVRLINKHSLNILKTTKNN